MILKNRTQEMAYFSKSNNFIGLAFVLVITVFALIYLKVNILYVTLPAVWILIEIFICIKNIKKGQNLNFSDIKEVHIEKDFIKFKSTNGDFTKYLYDDLKCINMQIETFICHAGGYSGNCMITSIKNTKIDFILKNDDIKSTNIFYYSRIGFLNSIKKILKSIEHKTIINIKYIGSGNIAEIKKIIEFL